MYSFKAERTNYVNPNYHEDMVREDIMSPRKSYLGLQRLGWMGSHNICACPHPKYAKSSLEELA